MTSHSKNLGKDCTNSHLGMADAQLALAIVISVERYADTLGRSYESPGQTVREKSLASTVRTFFLLGNGIGRLHIAHNQRSTNAVVLLL